MTGIPSSTAPQQRQAFVLDWIERTTREQDLPSKIEDASVIAKVVAIVQAGGRHGH
jgi:hypothetical protein